jgi:Fe-S oxidoreductase
MARYKSEVMYHRYASKRRPRHAYAFGLIDRWARLGRAAPGLANFVSHAPGLARLAKHAAGMAPAREIPRFAETSFRAWFEARRSERRPRAERRRRVLLWPDTFNDCFFPQTLAAAVEVLEQAGVEVDIPRARLCCGRPLYDYGMLDRAERYWREILRALRTDILAGTPIVGIEPSCVAAFRDELREMLPGERLAHQLSTQTKTLAEYLTSLDGYEPPTLRGARAIHHPHCHHHAVMGVEPDRALLARMEIAVQPSGAGCCGMAGAFGFEREHYDVSIACAERALAPLVRAQGDETLLIADGFSCREQIAQLTDRRALHLAEVLALALRRADVAGVAERRPEAVLATHVRRPEHAPAQLGATRAALTVGALVVAGSAAWYWLAPWLSRRRHRRRNDARREQGARRQAMGDRGGLHPGREPRARARDDQPRDRVPAQRDR